MEGHLLEIRDLSCHYPLSKGKDFKALDGISFAIRKGEIFGLVGESGSGKTTLARCVMNLCTASSGEIFFRGICLTNIAELRKKKGEIHRRRSYIFQDPATSLNHRMKNLDIILEPLRLAGIAPRNGAWQKEAEFQIERVGLHASYLDFSPAALSGGQRQRIAIARALAIQPELLIADEPVASLDLSAQAQIVNLFRALQREQGMSMLFIAHDLSMVKFLCNRIAVLFHGRIVEIAPTQELFAHPQHPYTKLLLASAPIPDPRRSRSRSYEGISADDISNDGILEQISSEHFVRIGKGGRDEG